MLISWILVLFLVVESAWTKIIPAEPTLNKFGQRIDNDDNILQLYPSWQPLQSDTQILQTPNRSETNNLPKIDILRTTNQLLPIGGPQAQGIKPQTEQFIGQIPQTKIFKTSTQEESKIQLSLNVPPDIDLPLGEQTTQSQELEPQSQALQGLSPTQYYQLLHQLNPYQDPRSFLPASNKPNYYKSSNLGPNVILSSQSKPSYYQDPSLNSGDISQNYNPNINYYQQPNNIPLQILAAPKETVWNPPNTNPQLYEDGRLKNRENIEISKPKAKIQPPVRTIPNHYKFEKSYGEKEKNKAYSKETPKNQLKNNIKESSDHISIKSAKPLKESNDWVPVVRTVPKHYTFENNNLEIKENAKPKNRLKGEPVEKVTKPKHYIFEKGTLVKKFKNNKFLKQGPLEEESLEQPTKSTKKKATKEKPVHEFLEPEQDPDANEKGSQILESQAPRIKPKIKKAKHKKYPSKDQVNSESYLNTKGADNNFHHENFNQFNGDLNNVHSNGASPPPASKQRMSFHMVGHDGPMSYKWGFDTGGGDQRQYRFEERDKEGIVKGQFGYLDDKGKFRKMNYNAHPVHGFSMEPADGTFDDLKP